MTELDHDPRLAEPPPPGWYSRPPTYGDARDTVTERYWDGQAWGVDLRVRPNSSDRIGVLATAGYVAAILLPFAGFILGIIVGIRHRPPGKNHGPWIMVVSVVALVLWFTLWVALVMSGATY